MTKTGLMILLITLNFGCNAPKIDPQIRCGVLLNFNYGTPEQIAAFFESIEQYKNPENQKRFMADVSAIFGKTRCHLYDIPEIKPTTEGQDFPLSSANQVLGFYTESWLEEITPWGKKLKQYYEDVCN